MTPEQETYDIGSRVTLNCTATPSPHKYRNYDFPVSYRWNGSQITPSNASYTTIIVVSLSNSEDHYCSIYRKDLLIGTGLTTLHVKSKYCYHDHIASSPCSYIILIRLLLAFQYFT